MIRKNRLEESASLIKSADTDKLKRHKEWITWSRAIKNYQLTIIGHYRVPLRYEVREFESTDYTIKSQPDYDFKQFPIK